MLKSRHMSYEYGEKPSRGLAYSVQHTSISHVIDQIDSESGLLSTSINGFVIFTLICIRLNLPLI